MRNRSQIPRRQVTRHGVPVVRGLPSAPVHRAAQGVEAPPLANSDDAPITPADADPTLPSTHPLIEDDDQKELSDNPAPLHIPEGSREDPDDPTSGHVQKADADTKPDYRIPGMEPPDAAPVPPNMAQDVDTQYPPEAAPVPDDLMTINPHHNFPPDAAPVIGVDIPDTKK